MLRLERLKKKENNCRCKYVFIYFNRRGIPAAPILNGYCGPYEVGMKQSMVNEPIFNYLY